MWKNQKQTDEKHFGKIELFNQKRSKKTIDLIILPHHTVILKLKIKANKEKVIESKIEIKFKPVFFKSINITYTYVI